MREIVKGAKGFSRTGQRPERVLVTWGINATLDW